jgi:magnesium-transporting ATPase (P-type)
MKGRRIIFIKGSA